MPSLFAISPFLLCVYATLFTYFVTALGASLVFFTKSVKQKPLDLMMGFAAGVMIAASFWSLILPAIELSEATGKTAWLIPAIGFFCGGFFIIGSDVFLERSASLFRNIKEHRCSALLSFAVTLHNIPEGLAIGVAFGCLASDTSETALISAVMLAIGIGLQNFPEGICVSLPLRREGMSRWKSFLIGQGSGMVEPIAGILGYLFAVKMQSILPFALTFSAGAMIAVVCSELIPESFRRHKTYAAIGVLLGFIIMMILDVALG